MVKRGFLADNLGLYVLSLNSILKEVVSQLPMFLNLGTLKPGKQSFILRFLSAIIDSNRSESYDLALLLKDSLLNYFTPSKDNLDAFNILYTSLKQLLKGDSELQAIRICIERVTSAKEPVASIDLLQKLRY